MEAVRGMIFTCIGRGHGAPAIPATREDWEKLRREPWLQQMCERVKKGDDELKNRLPWWTPHCAEYQNNHRAIADAVRPLNRLMLDFDEKGHTDEILEKLGIENGEIKANTCKPLLPLFAEESVRGGSHVLVELPVGMSAEEAQEIMKRVTGFEPDKVVKGVDRCIYMVSDDHTRYVNPRLFEVSEDNIFSKEYRNIGITEQSSDATSDIDKNPKFLDPLDKKESLEFKGIPYSSIIAEWWRRNGGEPAEGERNVKLHKLAVNLRAICDNRKDMLMQVMPRFGLTDVELKSVVDSACKEEPKGISKVMQGILDALEMGIPSDEVEDAEVVAEETGVKVNVAYNWTMLGTNGAMRKCFKSDNIENGLSSRILVAEMPDSSFSKMPKFGKRSAEDEARIQEAVTRLRSFTGIVDVPRLRKAIESWVEEKRVEAAKDIDHVKDTYRKRAAVIGFRCGVIWNSY